MNDELPCLDLLEATTAILRGLMEISEEDARWKPADDRFSIAEVLSHLSIRGALLSGEAGPAKLNRVSRAKGFGKTGSSCAQL